MIKVLIAEDEMRARRGLCSLLTMISDEVEIVGEASDGRSAFEMIQALKPDVVFTDIRMPYMDGIALIKAVREYGIDVKFVIISAYAEFEFARQAVSLGVVEYLVKPITLEDAENVWKKIKSAGKQDFDTKTGHLKDEYPQAHPLVQKALDMIECSYGTKFSQKEIAENLGISAEYFSFLFSRDVKESFSKFLRKYRMEKACQMLRDGNGTCEEIAYSVGFSDMKYFYKCFKDETGMNVSEYKRANC